VSEVLISFQWPASITASELRSWIASRAQTLTGALTLTGPPGLESRPPLLRVELRDDSWEPAEEQITGLVTDMRLLGLRPQVVPASDGQRADE
jgi:hypothetical protein